MWFLWLSSIDQFVSTRMMLTANVVIYVQAIPLFIFDYK